MAKELKIVESQLSDIVMKLQQEFVYTGELGEYLLNKGTPAADFLLESNQSEREFILHKLAPELMVEDVYEGNHIILKLVK